MRLCSLSQDPLVCLLKFHLLKGNGQTVIKRKIDYRSKEGLVRPKVRLSFVGISWSNKIQLLSLNLTILTNAKPMNRKIKLEFETSRISLEISFVFFHIIPGIMTILRTDRKS